MDHRVNCSWASRGCLPNTSGLRSPNDCVGVGCTGCDEEERHFYLLRGLSVCDTCGRTLAGRSSDGRFYYCCTSQGKHRDPDVPPHACSIAGGIVESLVWEAVCELLRHPHLLADAWQTQCETDDAEPDEADWLQGRLRSLNRQWTRLLDAFQDELIDKFFSFCFICVNLCASVSCSPCHSWSAIFGRDTD